jgi:hypothetical protein
MGPPGCQKMENARTLADTLGWKSIHPGQLMRNEVDKKTELGKKISDAQKSYHFGKLHINKALFIFNFIYS